MDRSRVDNGLLPRVRKLLDCLLVQEVEPIIGEELCRLFFKEGSNNTAQYQLTSMPVEHQRVMAGHYQPTLQVVHPHVMPAVQSYAYGGAGRGPASYVSQATVTNRSRLGLF
jgi:hypothetical protein